MRQGILPIGCLPTDCSAQRVKVLATIMPTTKLKLLAPNTEFSRAGLPFRKTTKNDPARGYACEPKLGGQFQTATELLVYIKGDEDVEVYYDTPYPKTS
jgi:hypothetical protein